MARKKLSKDMLVAAAEKGWSVSQTARQFEFSRSAIELACERFGITLPYHKFSPMRVSSRSNTEVSDVKVKAFSASPAAIERYLGAKA